MLPELFGRSQLEQIIRALREVEAGKKVGDVCRELGVSQQAFYSWKRRYAGLGMLPPGKTARPGHAAGADFGD